MDAPIEAKSLSSLNELADNPPRVLTPALRRQVRGNLVLYIARVPGSRDVFLTTMKPRAKVVTAQDVESSLYYCHLETPADEAIRASLQSLDVNEDDDEDDDDPATHGLLHPPESPRPIRHEDGEQRPPFPARRELDEKRPPLPARPTSEQAPPFVSSPGVSPTMVPEMRKIPRKPVGSQPSSKGPSPTLPVRPLGPRPLGQGYVSDRQPSSPGKENIRHLPERAPQIPPRRNTDDLPIPASSENVPTLTLRQNTGEWFGSGISRPVVPPPLPLRRNTDMSQMSQTSGPDIGDSSSASSGDSFVTGNDFKVTVIRRDPVTGSQWNIGRLTKESIETGSKARKAGKIELKIDSGAYDKFVDEESDAETSRNTPFKYTSFRRNMNLKRKKLSPRTSPMRSSHSGSHIGLSSASPSKSHPFHLPSSASAEGSPFSFTSPWYGLCEFVTGTSGRSLKCKHTFPLPQAKNSASFESQLAQLNSTAVSELRFNLPLLKHRRHASGSNPSKHRKSLSATPSSNSFFTSQSGTSPRLSARLIGLGRNSADHSPAKRSPERKSPERRGQHAYGPGDGYSAGGGRTQGYGHAPSRSMDAAAVDEEDEEDEWDATVAEDPIPLNQRVDSLPMDLSLGLERAGGGFAGNKAKLGKLIVEGEGVLFLDLLVMANMGVWWSVASR